MACEESPLWVHREVSLVETVNIQCVWVCVCVRARVCLSQSERERGTAVGLCPGLQGGIRTTLTHTVLLLSLLFYPSHDPSLPLFFLPFFSHHLFPLPCVSQLLYVPLALLICVVVAVISVGTVSKQSKVITLKWVFDPAS